MKKIFTRLSLTSLALLMAMLPAFAGCSGEEKPPVSEDPPKVEEPDEKDPPENEDPDPEPEPEPEPDPTPDPVYGIVFEESALCLATVEEYNEMTLVANVHRDGDILADVTPTYTVADESVATVEGALLTAISAGETIVTASYTINDVTMSESVPLIVLAASNAEAVNSFNEEAVNLFGRTYVSAKKLTFDNVCTGIEVAFAGTELTAKLYASTKSKVRVYVDGDTEGTALVVESTRAKDVKLCENLEDGVHTVRILKAASQIYGKVYLPDANAFSTDGTFLAAREKPELKIEFIGDSITAGCGANGEPNETQQTVENSDPTLAYSYLTAQALGADFSMLAREGICAKDGAFSAYSTYKQYSTNYTVKYDPAQFDADVVVLALGENDMWHATSDQFPNYNVELFRADYADMLRLIRESHPTAHIVCIYGMMPASSTLQTTQTIQAAIEDTGDENISMLKMISNERGANYHPNAATHKLNADSLTKHIKKLLQAAEVKA